MLWKCLTRKRVTTGLYGSTKRGFRELPPPPHTLIHILSKWSLKVEQPKNIFQWRLINLRSTHRHIWKLDCSALNKIHMASPYFGLIDFERMMVLLWNGSKLKFYNIGSRWQKFTADLYLLYKNSTKFGRLSWGAFFRKFSIYWLFLH